jgi:protein-S-isoprenylcysteine O-methyltransferase Ste14
MATVALALVLLYGALAFGVQSRRQRRATGDAGFRGVSGPVGSAAWWGGVLFGLAVVLVAAAPLLTLAGVVDAGPPAPPRAIAGVVAFAAGLAGTVWAQRTMGASWRIGVDPAERTGLVRGGPFGRVRNPIFSAMVLAVAGLVLLVPGPVAPAAAVVLVVAIELQVRVVEEPYLDRVHGAAWRDYAARTGRFVPGVGRLPRRA